MNGRLPTGDYVDIHDPSKPIVFQYLEGVSMGVSNSTCVTNDDPSPVIQTVSLLEGIMEIPDSR